MTECCRRLSKRQALPGQLSCFPHACMLPGTVSEVPGPICEHVLACSQVSQAYQPKRNVGTCEPCAKIGPRHQGVRQGARKALSAALTRREMKSGSSGTAHWANAIARSENERAFRDTPRERSLDCAVSSVPLPISSRVHPHVRLMQGHSKNYEQFNNPSVHPFSRSRHAREVSA